MSLLASSTLLQDDNNLFQTCQQVDHGILLQKLAEHRVNRSFWLWVKSFLEHRSQQVKVGDTLSSIMPCPLGVPQGSVLSPTLFNIHIDDLQDSVPVQLDVDTCMYADDCTQDETIKIGHTSNMQVVLNAAKNWADKNKMVLNAKKTNAKITGSSFKNWLNIE